MTESKAPPFVLIELVLGGLVAIGPLSIDMYLPAFSAIATDFAVGEERVQLSLASYFVGLALGQLIMGPLLDRFGRKRPLLLGLALYVAASVGCMLAPGINGLIVGRFVQALGGASAMVASRAVVRDLRSGAEAAQLLSRLILVMGLAPILAPAVGGEILGAVGWRGIFAALAIFGTLAAVGAARLLPNIAPAPTTGSTLVQARALFAEPDFLRATLTGAFAMAGMFAYIAGSPFVFIELFDVPTDRYGWIFGLNAAGLIACSQLNHRLLRTRSPRQIVRVATWVAATAGVALLAGSRVPALGLWGLAAPLFVYIASLGALLPNATALALEAHAARAGVASAVMGAIRFGVAFAAAAVVSGTHDGTALPMAGSVAGFGALALVIWLLPAPPLAAAAR